MSKSPSLRRIQADIRELALDPSDRYHAAPLEDDMFEWHFTIRGADGTDFEGGVYHGRILLPPEYPFKPPNIVFLTPSGRFETGTKVCLSFSAYHPELWQPAWGIRLILEALISFLPTPADGAIGALDWSSAERKKLATKSVDYCCPRCGKAVALLPKLSTAESRASASRFQKEIERLHQLQWEHEGKKKAEAAAAAAAKEAGESGEVNSGTDLKKEESDDKKEATEGDGSSQKSDEPKSATIEPANVVAPDIKPPASVVEESKIPELRPDNSFERMASEIDKILDEHIDVDASKDVPVTNSAANPAEHTTTPALAQDAAAATTTTTTEIVDVATEAPVVDDPISHWIIDPLLQATVLLLAIICYMLIRKGQELYEEIRRLDSN